MSYHIISRFILLYKLGCYIEIYSLRIHSNHLWVIIMKLITVHLPDAYLQGLDKLIDADAYPNRSEAIRVAVAIS